MPSRTVVLVIARSPHFQEILSVLLRSIPQIERIYLAEDGPSALALELGAQPALVLLDDDSSAGELRTTLGQIKATWPQAARIVFLDNEQDCRRVQDAGGDVVLLKGVRAPTILETIEGLLSKGNPIVDECVTT